MELGDILYIDFVTGTMTFGSLLLRKQITSAGAINVKEKIKGSYLECSLTLVDLEDVLMSLANL